jgi:predicted nucleotide-binding protein (sugar kinase/HSP70/actin superfamily)
MKHIIYHVQVKTLTGWHNIYSDPCYPIALMFAQAAKRYTVNLIRIINPSLNYDERI